MIRSTGARLGKRTLVVLAISSLSPALFAQQQQLDREITFVRSLARELRFIELARLEAERLATEFRAGGDQDKIAQLAVEISFHGATSRSDRAQRRTLFKETIDKSKELIERSSDAGVQLDARATLANASQEFGQFLVEELEIAREESPERIKELAAEAAGVFRAGIDACDKVMAVLKDQRKNPEKEIEYFLVWMKKGVLMREQGRADKENRSVLCARAIEELTNMVFEAGEETAIGLRGLFEISQCKEVEGNIPDAIGSYRGAIKQITTSLKDANEGKLELSGELQNFLFEMLQEVYVRTAEVMVREGAPGTAELFTEFRASMTDFGEKGVELFDVVSEQHGHLMLLAECKFMAESGDAKKVGDALAMAKRINEQHPSDYVGVRAKAVLRDILAVQRGLVSGSLLFEVGKGELQNKNYEEAVKGLRRALAAMSPDEQQKLGLEAHQMLGTAYALTDRYLEAVIALTAGLKKYADTNKDRASETADALDRAISALKRQSKNDPAFEPLYGDAASLMAKTGGSSGNKLFWKQANESFTDKKWTDAIAQFKQISPEFQLYEQARVNIARAHSSTGDFANARKELGEYRAWASGNALPASDTGKLQARAQAMALAELVEVQMLYAEARGDEEFKLKKDLTKYPAAIEKAQSFLTNFAKDGADNAPLVLSYVGRLYADLGQLDRAEDSYTQLKAKDPLRASRLATEVFKEYQGQLKTLTDELDQAIAKDKGEAAIGKATADVAAVRARLVALGMDYIAGSPKPQLPILVATMNGWEVMEDWKRVEEVAAKTIELYGADAASKKTVDPLVRPKIGEALLRQERFQEAYDMLVAAEKANPQQWELKRQIALALGGWFYIDKQGRPRPVPALEKPVEAFKKYYGDRDGSYRVWALRPEVKQFSLEWYRFHWEAYWFAKQAGAKDGRYKRDAEALYKTAKSTDDFATLKSHGVEGARLFNYFRSAR